MSLLKQILSRVIKYTAIALFLCITAAYAQTAVSTIWGAPQASIAVTNRIPVDQSALSGPGQMSVGQILNMISGDCTVNINSGAITCTKANGVSFAAVATSGSAADLTSGTLVAARLPNPSASTLGGIESITAAGSKWINSITTSGLPVQTQPNESDLAFTDIVTSNSSTSKHGFLKKLTGTASQYMDGTGAWSTPAGTGDTNLTGPITSVGNVTSVASQTGTGSTFVMNNGAILIAPALGTPASGVMTNVSGTAADLTAGHVTTNANLTGPITSTGNAITSLTAHNVLLGEGAGALAYAPPISLGYVLTDNGPGNDPTFQAASGGSGTVTTTGSPSSGNLAKFSGSTSITAGDLSGDVNTNGTLVTTLATVNSNTGNFGSGSSIPNFTVTAKGTITAAGSNAITAPISGITGLGTGVATWAATPSAANFASAMTNAVLTATGGSGQAQTIFSPETYYTSGDDTASLQAAITAAEPTCGHVVLEGRRYHISNSALSASGCVEISGVQPMILGSDVITPVYPYFTNGTVIEQDTAAADVIDCPGIASTPNFHDFGVTFGESIIFSNTGHGINCTPPALNTALNQGPLYFDWHNLAVFGHDGNHYAYTITNAEYWTLNNLWSIGGGALQLVNNTSAANYASGAVAYQNGNGVIGNIFAVLAVNGTANCYDWYSNQSLDSGSILNLVQVSGRLQCNVIGYGTINGHTITTPTQQAYNGHMNHLGINQLDIEPTTTAGYSGQYSTAGSWHIDLSSEFPVSTSDSNFGATIQPYEAGMNGTYGQRRHYTDLSTRLTALESAGSTFSVIQDSANQGPTYATDGTRSTGFPGTVAPLSAPSGYRWAGASPQIGAAFFDTTVNKLLTYNGSIWLDGAGNAAVVSASMATSASDNFSVTTANISLPAYYSTGGQRWTTYTSSGSANFSTNGTYAKSTVSNGAAGNYAWLFTNNYNGTAAVTFTVVGNSPRLIFRLSDRSNFWSMQTTQVQKVVNGTGTTPASGACTYTALTSGAVPTVVLSGSTITIKNGSTTLCTITDTFNGTATGYGIGVYADTTSEFENFSVINDSTVAGQTSGTQAGQNANFTGTLSQGGVQVISTAGVGTSQSGSTLNSNAVYQISFQPGLMTSVSNAKSSFAKVSKTSTVDNIEVSAQQFSCTGNPTVTMYECGTSTTCASTPVTIGSATITAAGTVVDGTVSNATITAGDYIAFAISAGTCVTLDVSATAQVHSN